MTGASFSPWRLRGRLPTAGGCRPTDSAVADHGACGVSRKFGSPDDQGMCSFCMHHCGPACSRLLCRAPAVFGWNPCCQMRPSPQV